MAHGQDKYAKILARIRSIENVRGHEFVTQHALTLIASVTAWVAIGLWQIMIWYAFHISAVFFEKWLLWRFADRPSRGVFFSVLAANQLVATVFMALPVWLWFLDGEIFQYAAMALITGATLNTLLVRTQVWQLLVCYLLTNGMAFVIIAFTFWQMDVPVGHAISATVVAAAVLIYFLVAAFESVRLHKQHRATQQALTRAHKLEAIGQFSEGIAHDFNNVLNVIIGNLELLKQPDNPYATDDLLDDARAAAERGTKLATQLQTLGRGQEVAPVHVDVSSMLREVKGMVQRVLPSNIALSVAEDGFLPTVYVDETLMHAALLNLGLNARDAMPDGGEILLEAWSVSAQSLPGRPLIAAPYGPASFVCVSVSDSGVGMTNSEITQVTEPFFTTKQHGKGVGLGLTTVASFVQRNQGAMAIDSTPGQGTRVAIYLPVYPQAALRLRAVGPARVRRQISGDLG